MKILYRLLYALAMALFPVFATGGVIEESVRMILTIIIYPISWIVTGKGKHFMNNNVSIVFELYIKMFDYTKKQIQ